MAQKVIVKLNQSYPYGGAMHHPGQVLIEAKLPESLTAEKLHLAIKNGAVDFETAAIEEPEEEPSILQKKKKGRRRG